MGDLIYLDYNCFQRAFDDRRQVRVRIEAVACEAIFDMAERGRVSLVWSFMHDDECELCPYPHRRTIALTLSTLCTKRVAATDEVRRLAMAFQERATLSAKDAIHLACACAANADALLTCDDHFTRRARRLTETVQVMNPVDYLRKREGG